MLNVYRIGVTKKPVTGTPGSSAAERGFDIEIATTPSMAAYRVAIIWTEDGWRTVHHTEAQLTDSSGNRDVWKAGVSFFASQPITFFYALVAAGPDGQVWDNNGGWNYAI